MLWDHYVYRRGDEVPELWDSLLSTDPVNLLYIAGRGFDVRAQTVMRDFVAGQTGRDRNTASAKLVLLAFDKYELDENIQALTEENAAALEKLFSPLGTTHVLKVESDEGEEASPSEAL